VVQRGGLHGAIAQVKSEAHQQGAGQSLAAFGHDGGATGDAVDRPWGMGVPLRPRFGSREAGARREASSAGWLMQPASIASATPLRAPRLPKRRGCGCGCPGCQGGH
jgi:hypothetical protein